MRSRALSSCCISFLSATLTLGAHAQQRGLVEPNIHILMPDVPDAKMDGVTISSKPFVPQSALLVANANSVQLSVVVRDAAGRAEPDLTKSDFLLYADGKQHPIQYFSAFNPVSAPVPAPAPAPPAANVSAAPAAASRRTVALYFDDYSMTYVQLAMAREAATKFIQRTPAAGMRLGVFSSSGAVESNFSASVEDWLHALNKLSYQGRMTPDGGDDPLAISPALADQIEAVSTSTSPYLQQVASQYRSAGFCRDPDSCQELAKANAQQTLERAIATASDTFVALSDVVKALASQPQPRILLLVSSGFLNTHAQDQQSALVEQALRAGVVVDTLDARLLETEPSGKSAQELATWLSNRFTLDGALESLADSTGGRFSHNNDMLGAMRNAAELAEPRYTLAFNPAAMRADGKFHKLKVRLAAGHSGDIQTRDGYYDPEPDASTDGHARPSVLSADVMHRAAVGDVPIDVRAGFSTDKSGRTSVRVNTRVSIVSHREHLDMVTAVFDLGGRFVTGRQTQVDLDLSNARFKSLAKTGFGGVITLPLPPGVYRLREVVVVGGDHGKTTVRDFGIQIPRGSTR